MITIHLDAVGGIAGDMFVAAMLDAMPDLKARVLADGTAVLPQEAGRVALNQGDSGGIRVLRFGLETVTSPLAPPIVQRVTPTPSLSPTPSLTPTPHPSPQGGGESGDVSAQNLPFTDSQGVGAEQSPSPVKGVRSGGIWQSTSSELSGPAHAGTDHLHTHGHDEHEPHGHHHHGHGERNDGSYRDMVARIETAPLHPGTAGHAIAILTILATAEAAIHQVPVEDVHFHEIADWDSLADVVCAGSIAAALDNARWSVSPLPRGGGLARTAHGLLPVPAPATVAILQGFDWRDDGIAGERVTPTGAAILQHLVTPDSAHGSGRLVASGTGAGTRNLPGMPNILRALVFEEADPLSSDRIAVIEFEVDDMTGEEIGVAAERLRGVDGVLDLSIGQRLGKKGRPMQSFRLLTRADSAEPVAARCFAETSTIGLRQREERRRVLAREDIAVAGVPVKAVARPGGRTVKAESDAISGDSLAERRARKHRAEHGDD